MKLYIGKRPFAIESLMVNEHGAEINSAQLESYIANMEDDLTKARAVIATMPDDNLAPSAPPKKLEPIYEIVEAENLPYTIEQFKASKWTEAQLLKAGHLIKREVVPGPDSPTDEVVTAAPPPSPDKVVVEGQFEVEGQLYMMSAKAAGASYEQFQSSGWKLEALISEGYASMIGGESTSKGGPKEEKTFPFLNAEGDWEDADGTIWDEARHSMGSNKQPPVTTKGVFKKTRKRSTTPAAPKTEGVPSAPITGEHIPAAPGDDGVPSAPGASEAGGVPSAPGASEAEGIPSAPSTGDDEPLDDELADIVKNWG